MERTKRLSPTKAARIIHGKLLKLSERKIAKAVPCSKRTVQEYAPVSELLQFAWLLAEHGVIKINALEAPSSPPAKDSDLR